MAQTQNDPTSLGRATSVFQAGLTVVLMLVTLSAAAPVLAEDRAEVGKTATGTLQIRLVLPPRVTVEAAEPSAIQTQTDDRASDQFMVCLHHMPIGNVRVLWEKKRPENHALQAAAIQGTRTPFHRPGCYFTPDSHFASSGHQRVLIAAE